MKIGINEVIKELLDFVKPSRTKDAMHYALTAGGKRIRPLLLLSVIDAYGIDPTPYIKPALSLEMIHTYSLIHDDLPAMDDDALRRGKPTVHIAFDEATAILAGDGLLTDAFYLIAKDPTLSDSQKIDWIRILSDKAGASGMVYGQQMDLTAENQTLSLDELQNIHAHKTAKLIEAPLMMGAIIGNKTHVDLWEKIGTHLGVLFQIQDDILEVTSSEEKMGKSLSDAKNMKSTYVSLLGLQGAKHALEQEINTLNELLKQLNLEKDTFHQILQSILERSH